MTFFVCRTTAHLRLHPTCAQQLTDFASLESSLRRLALLSPGQLRMEPDRYVCKRPSDSESEALAHLDALDNPPAAVSS